LLEPTLTVNDVKTSVSFFEGLGFAVDERWEDKGVLQGVMLRAGEARIGLSQDDWKQGRDRTRQESRHRPRFAAARHGNGRPRLRRH
jgi:hypothetical protein